MTLDGAEGADRPLDALRLEFELGEQLDGNRGELNIPGMAVAVIQGSETVWSGGYGVADLEREVPVTRKTVFHLGSITKLFTAVALMQLREAGTLSLDDPVERFIPEFHVPSDLPIAQRLITLRTLAAHTSGLPHMPALAVFRDQVDMIGALTRGTFVYPPVEAILQSLPATERISSPGDEMHYSNLGYILLGIVIERAANRPYRDVVRESILAPLGMEGSGFEITASMRARLAAGYVTPSTPITAPGTDMAACASAGGLSSTVLDLARCVAFFLVGNERVLSMAALREMCTPVWMDRRRGEGSAIGPLVLSGSRYTVLRHLGADEGYMGAVAWTPEHRIGVALLTNAGAMRTPASGMDRMALDTLDHVIGLADGSRPWRDDPRV